MTKLRMKNRLNQTVCGSNYHNPIDVDVTNIYHHNGVEKGRVKFKGKKYPVRSIGGGVWILLDDIQISDIYPEVNDKKMRAA